MPKGKHLPVETRQKIYQSCIVDGMSAKEAHAPLFGGNNDMYTLKSLNVLVSKLHSMSGGEVSKFLAGPTPRKGIAGRKRKYSGATVDKLVELRKEETTATLRTIVDKFQRYYSDGKSLKAPSRSTLSRLYRREHISPNTTTSCVVMDT